jgi:hypothetical protein
MAGQSVITEHDSAGRSPDRTLGEGDEIAYVRDRLIALGTKPLVIDSGSLGEPGIRPTSHGKTSPRAG